MQLPIFRSIGKFVVDWLLVVVKTFLNIYKYLVLGAVKEKHFTVTASLRASSTPPPPSTARHGPRPGVRPVVTGGVKCPVCLERDCCRDAVYTSGVPRMRSPHRTTITSARALSGEPVNIRPFFIIFIEETISSSPFICLLCCNQPLIIAPSTIHLFL